MTIIGTFQVDLNSKEFDHLRRSRSDNPPVPFNITFPRPFPSQPVVMLGLTGFQGGGDHFKFRMEPTEITEAGFKVLLYTNRNWIDALEISYLAINA